MPVTTIALSKVKLDSKNKDFLQIKDFATTHRDAMAGNANFATSGPTPAGFDAFLSTYAEKTSGGEAAPTPSIGKPAGVTATMGGNPGEIDVSCDPVYLAKSYLYEIRMHSDLAAPGDWGGTKVSPRSTTTFSGLASGMKYSFRVRTLGPNGLQSPWSDGGGCMAP